MVFSRQPVVTANADLVISNVNEQALAVLGTSTGQLLGQRVDALIHSAEADGRPDSVYQTVWFAVPIPSALPKDIAENNELRGRTMDRRPLNRRLSRSTPAARNIHFDKRVKQQNGPHRLLPTYSHLFCEEEEDVLVVGEYGLFETLKSFTVKRTKDEEGSDPPRPEIDESDEGRKLRVAYAESTRDAAKCLEGDRRFSLILCPCDAEFVMDARSSGTSCAIVVVHNPDRGTTPADAFEIGANGVLYLRRRGFFRSLGNILSDLVVR